MIRKLARAVLFLTFCAATCLSSPPAQGASRLGCHVNIWVHGQSYTGRVVRSGRTSCPFARRVTAKSLTFIVNAGGVGDGDFYVRVYSPVTHKTYRMHCYADGDLNTSEGMNVTCTGGVGARVHYKAWSR